MRTNYDIYYYSFCFVENPCESNQCQNGALCQLTTSSYICRCPRKVCHNFYPYIRSGIDRDNTQTFQCRYHGHKGLDYKIVACGRSVDLYSLYHTVAISASINAMPTEATKGVNIQRCVFIYIIAHKNSIEISHCLSFSASCKYLS
jgi:hypothetical protein